MIETERQQILLTSDEKQLFIDQFENVFSDPKTRFIKAAHNSINIPFLQKEFHPEDQSCTYELMVRRIDLNKYIFKMPCDKSILVYPSVKKNLISATSICMANCLRFDYAQQFRSFDPPEYIVLKTDIKMWYAQILQQKAQTKVNGYLATSIRVGWV
ncbi:MAG: hypothetical protein ACTSRG_25060 [Candidatus Helarchaeota archaeon]